MNTSPQLPSTKCTGCSACAHLCPVAAIQMVGDREGFLYPQVDNAVCTHCGLCEKRCPVLEPQTPQITEQPEAYACINMNELIRSESSSGGMFTLFAEYVIDHHGIVFGAMFTTDFSVEHGWTDTKEGLATFRGSKYVQSDVKTSYKTCKEFLETGRMVLFSGTPCQIGGLKSYLTKTYDTLFCVDLICHGVPSPHLWHKYVQFREKTAGSKTRRIAFRRKNCGWKLYSLLFTFANNKEYSETLQKDSYMQLFLRDICLRLSCYECSFKTLYRQSDMTLADFWGVEKIVPEMFDDKGTSLVFVHSQKGKSLFDLHKKKCNIKKVNVSEALQFNSAMITSAKRPCKRNRFAADLNRMEINLLYKKYATDGIKDVAKSFARKILGQEGVNVVKKLLGKQ